MPFRLAVSLLALVLCVSCAGHRLGRRDVGRIDDLGEGAFSGVLLQAKAFADLLLPAGTEVFVDADGALTDAVAAGEQWIIFAGTPCAQVSLYDRGRSVERCLLGEAALVDGLTFSSGTELTYFYGSKSLWRSRAPGVTTLGRREVPAGAVLDWTDRHDGLVAVDLPAGQVWSIDGLPCVSETEAYGSGLVIYGVSLSVEGRLASCHLAEVTQVETVPCLAVELDAQGSLVGATLGAEAELLGTWYRAGSRLALTRAADRTLTAVTCVYPNDGCRVQ